jgi:transcriptional regulator with XRE-family HTH domain
MKASRLARGTSQADEARAIGISVALLRELEAGRAQPTARVAALLETAFGESVRGLLKRLPASHRLPQLRQPIAS